MNPGAGGLPRVQARAVRGGAHLHRVRGHGLPQPGAGERGLSGTTKYSSKLSVCGWYVRTQVSQVGHSYPVDLWGMGVLLYEIAIGSHPFSSNSEVVRASYIHTFIHMHIYIPTFIHNCIHTCSRFVSGSSSRWVDLP